MWNNNVYFTISGIKLHSLISVSTILTFTIVVTFTFSFQGGFTSFWIGLNWLGGKQFQWLNGNQPIYTNWGRDEPIAFGDYRCPINRRFPDGVFGWFVDDCTYKRASVCEKQF